MAGIITPGANPVSHIRAANVNDLDAIMAIEQVAHAHPWARSIMLRYLEKPGVCRVLENNGEILAYAVVTVIAAEAELLTIAVAPAAQGRGLGQVMTDDVITSARQREAQQIFLEVRESNQNAIAVYEKAGFCQAGRRPGYYPLINRSGKTIGREDALLYVLPLL